MIQDETCECGVEEQKVEHVRLRCGLADEARVAAQLEGMEHTIQDMLYTDRGIEWTIKIWEEFERERRKATLEGEREESKERDKQWGLGDVKR